MAAAAAAVAAATPGLPRQPDPRLCTLPGGKLPIVVGTQGGGLYNFSPNLQIPFSNTRLLIAPTNTVPGAGATLGLAFLSDLEVYFFLTAAQGDTRTQHPPGAEGDHVQRRRGDDLHQPGAVLRQVADADRRPRLGGVRAADRPRSPTA